MNNSPFFNEAQFEIECISGTKKVIYNQSEAEIQLWSISEQITDSEKGMLFLGSGFPQQKLWALHNLDKVLTENPTNTLEFIQSQILSENWDVELKKAFGVGIISALKQGLVPKSLFEDMLEISILFLGSLSSDLHESWISVFSLLVSNSTSESIISRAVSFVINLSDFNQKSIFRLISCKLLKIIAEKLKFEVKGQLLQRAKALSQDTNSEVRQEMCITWITICYFKPKSEIEEMIFYEIAKLVEDEVNSVKTEANICLIKILPLLSREFINSNVMPILQRHLFIEASIQIQIRLSEYFGELLLAIKPLISSEIRELCLHTISYFLDSDFLVRKNLAYNFPAIFSVLGPCEKLKEYLTLLVHDEEPEIRICIAYGLHEISKCDISCRTVAFLASQLLEDPFTQYAIIKNTHWWANRIPNSNLLSKLAVLINAGNWRSQKDFLIILNENISKFSIKNLLDEIAPLLLRKMQTDNWALKTLSAKVLSNILYNTHYTARKSEIFSIINDKFAVSNISYNRILFLFFSEFSMAQQSKEFFAKTYLETLLKFSSDPIESVRIKLSTMLPLIREVVPDRLIFQVENLTEILIEDSSLFVRNLAKNSKEIMKSDEFNKKIYSDEEQKEFMLRNKFEEDQVKLDTKEIEDSKRRMVIEFASKAKEALRQRRTDKPLPHSTHSKSKSVTGSKSQKIAKPTAPARAGSSSRPKKLT